MEKLIIENRTSRPISEVLPYIQTVLMMGRISANDDQYCYHSAFAGDVYVSAYKNKKSDRLVVWSEQSATGGEPMSRSFYPIRNGDSAAFECLHDAFWAIDKAIEITGIDDSQPDHAANDGAYQSKLELAKQLIEECMELPMGRIDHLST